LNSKQTITEDCVSKSVLVLPQTSPFLKTAITNSKEKPRSQMLLVSFLAALAVAMKTACAEL